MRHATVTISFPEELAQQLPAGPEERQTVLELGLREWQLRRALESYRQGNGSLAYAARQAGISLREMIPLCVRPRLAAEDRPGGPSRCRSVALRSVSVVSDSGPLMALAKTGGLGVLFRLFPSVLTPPAVYEELVTEGLRLGAPDALLLQEEFHSARLTVRRPASSSLPRPDPLGRGEEESILLAIELRAPWLLVDDLDARRAAVSNFEAVGVATRVKGTLGVIVSACQAGILSREAARGMIVTLSEQPDIWISSRLCDRAMAELY